MSRKHIIQVALTAGQHEAAEREATALDMSVSAWAAHQIFPPGDLRVRAKFCHDFRASSAEADALVRAGNAADGCRVQTMLDLLPYEELVICRLLDGGAGNSAIWEVRTKEGAPISPLPLGPDSRLVVSGSPWPYRVTADYSVKTDRLLGRSGRVVLALIGVRDEQAFVEVKAA